jgi:hypothetical protein
MTILMRTRSRGRLAVSSESYGADAALVSSEMHFEVNGLISGGRLRLTLGFSKTSTRRRRSDAGAPDRGPPGSDRHCAHRGVAAALPSFSAARLDRASLMDCSRLSKMSMTSTSCLRRSRACCLHTLRQTADAYFNQLTCVLEGALDLVAFQEAWRVVTARHPALRTSFHWKDLECPVQVVHLRAEIPWFVEDWSARSADERERRWVKQAEEDRRRPFDVSTPPLMRCALSRIGHDTYRFRWSQHHLLLDGWSSAIVLDDVLAAYDAIVRGEKFEAPSPPRFRDNIRWLQQQDQAAAQRFWRRQLEGFASPTPLVLGLPEMEGRVEPWRFGEAEMALSDALGSRLKSLAAEHRITLNTLFQGVWSILLSRHSGERDVVFGAIVSVGPRTSTDPTGSSGCSSTRCPRARLDEEAPVFACCAICSATTRSARSTARRSPTCSGGARSREGRRSSRRF